jgi:hypothetical protein
MGRAGIDDLAPGVDGGAGDERPRTSPVCEPIRAGRAGYRTTGRDRAHLVDRGSARERDPGDCRVCRLEGSARRAYPSARRRVGRSRVTVNAVAPGYFTGGMSDPAIATHGEDLIARIPAGRLGGADDLKGVVVFLASDAARFVTGQVIAVDGGQSVLS